MNSFELLETVHKDPPKFLKLEQQSPIDKVVFSGDNLRWLIFLYLLKAIHIGNLCHTPVKTLYRIVSNSSLASAQLGKN